MHTHTSQKDCMLCLGLGLGLRLRLLLLLLSLLLLLWRREDLEQGDKPAVVSPH